ncbi:hypothetical protein CC79DRAFT_667272 [Sarocladium strictum]
MSRIRRVKCDEAKPCCQRCISTGRKCDGYRIQPQQPQTSLVLITAPDQACTTGTTPCGVRARMTFQTFKVLHAHSLSSYGTAGFWQSVVLQASDQSGSIKHLLIAATSLSGVSPSQGNMLDTCASESKGNVPFLAHYGVALQYLRNCAASDVIVVLVACVLLALCDEMQNNDLGAQRHIEAGKKILASQAKEATLQRWEHTMVLNEIASTLSRLCAPRPATSHLPHTMWQAA